MAPKNYTPQKNSDHEEENNNADGEQQMEDSNNSQNAPEDGLGDTCPTSALPASSPSSEDEREWNSRFDPTTPNGGCFWMALNSDGSVCRLFFILKRSRPVYNNHADRRSHDGNEDGIVDKVI